VSSDHALSSLDMIGLAQLQSLADHPQLFAVAGKQAAHLSQLQAQNVAIVDGFVLPTGRFIEHCQRAAIPASLVPDAAAGQTWQTLAQQCQAAIRQTSCTDWLPSLPLTWQRSPLNYPLVVLRPSFGAALPSVASDLLTPQIGAIDELEPMLKALWSEVFCARNLGYWSQYCGDLGQLPLATVIQPLRTIIQSGRLWVTERTLMVERFWGVQWLGHPQEMEVPVRVIDRATGQGRSSPANPQQLVHAILGHWPPALPLVVPLIVAGDQWLLPHPLAAGDRGTQPASPVTDAMLVELAAALTSGGSETMGTQFPLPLRVDWQYSHDQLQVQAIYPGEAAPLATRLATLADDPVLALTGLVAAPGLGVGRAVVVAAEQPLTVALTADCILVTPQLRPDWLPLIRNAAGIVTEQGGMTSHGAVMARSLGIPAIVGVAQATQSVRSGDWLKLEAGQVQPIAASVARALMAERKSIALLETAVPITKSKIPSSSTQLLVSIIDPSQVTSLGKSRWDGIGLVRGEHLLAAALGDCSPWSPLGDRDADRLSRELARSLAAVMAVGDGPVWYRLADWRSGEMPVGMAVPAEVNPALGMHGGLYYQHFPEWLGMELGAIGRLNGRERLRVVLPFVRTAVEVRDCRAAMVAAGLGDVALWVMAEVPAIVYALPECAAAGIQGVAIGLNDLVQLWFGVDREAALMTDFFDPNHANVRSVVRSGLAQLIQTARALGLDCTVCSVPPDAALIEFLVDCGVTGIVVNPLDRDRVAQLLN
jgi:pyruvate, water dikinase